VISGEVDCDGEFHEVTGGWLWRDEAGEVRLGEVRVFDAAGEKLEALMEVNASGTRIVVAAQGLARAAYPVTIDPEIGANDFRISSTGLIGDDLSRRPNYPAVAYNSTDNEYLVVWSADEVDNEFEIYGQRIDAATGARMSMSDFRISDMGPDGDLRYAAVYPAVTYNATDNEYLVVWKGGDSCCAVNEFEIFGQRIAADGTEIGPNDLRISFMGAEGSTSYMADWPAVAWDSAVNRYLVVWSGDERSSVE
jgi:hypothetical protein